MMKYGEHTVLYGLRGAWVVLSELCATHFYSIYFPISGGLMQMFAVKQHSQYIKPFGFLQYE